MKLRKSGILFRILGISLVVCTIVTGCAGIGEKKYEVANYQGALKEGELVLKDLSGDPEEAWSLVPQALKEISPKAKTYALVYTGEADDEEEEVSLILMECGEKEAEEGYFLGLPYHDLGYGPEFDELAYLGESDNPCYYLEEE